MVPPAVLGVVRNVLEGAVFLLVLWIAARLLRRIARRALAGRKVRADVALLTERVLDVFVRTRTCRLLPGSARCLGEGAALAEAAPIAA